MEIVCLDLEGVLIPEIWINFAEYTGIEGLKATTRDIPDYDELMQQRLGLLDANQLTLNDIQKVIGQMKPLPGAAEFVEWVRTHFQLVILSDTFYEFAKPLMQQLGWPTLLCHRLEVDQAGKITDYKIRQKDPKRQSVKSLQALNYRIISAGDSYNDTTMLEQAETGIFFSAPSNVLEEFPQYESTTTYDELKAAIAKASVRDIPTE